MIPQCIEEATTGLMPSHGLPHHLYESTLNLLYSILKPDVLHADEMSEFCRRGGNDIISSFMPTLFDLSAVAAPSSQSNVSSSSQPAQPPLLPPLTPLESSQTNSTNTSLHDLPAAATTTSSLNGSMSHLASAATTAAAVTQTSVASSPLPTPSPSLDLEAIWIDKLLRAVFVRLFAQLFAGYRYCLLIIRINPKPVIRFNKASFLANHGLVDNEFMNRLLDSMSFQRLGVIVSHIIFNLRILS